MNCQSSFLYCLYLLNKPLTILTAALAYWLECLPHEQEVMGLIPGCSRPKSLKLVVMVFTLGIQEYGNSTMTVKPVSR